MIGAIPIEFILFGLTLVGVAVFHRHTLAVAVSGRPRCSSRSIHPS